MKSKNAIIIILTLLSLLLPVSANFGAIFTAVLDLICDSHTSSPNPFTTPVPYNTRCPACPVAPADPPVSVLKMTELSRQNTGLRSALETANGQRDHAYAEVAVLRGEVKNLTGSLADARAAHTSALDRAASERDAADTVIYRLKVAVGLLVVLVIAGVVCFLHKAAVHTRTLGSKDAQILTLRHEVGVAHADSATLRTALDCREAIHTRTLGSKDAQILTLRNDVDGARADCATLRTEVDAWRRAFPEIYEVPGSILDNIAVFHAEFQMDLDRDTDDSVETVSEPSTDYSGDVSAVRATGQAYGDVIASLAHAEVVAARTATQTAVAERDASRAEATEARTALAASERRTTEVDAKLVEAESAVAERDQRIANLTSENTGLHADLAKANAAVDADEAKYTELRLKYTEVVLSIHALAAADVHIRAKNSRLEAAAVQTEAALAVFRAESDDIVETRLALATANADRAVLTGDRATIVTEINFLESENKGLVERVKRLVDQVDKLEKDNEGSSAELARAVADAAGMKEDHDSAQGTIGTLRDNITTLTAERDSAKAHIVDLTTAIFNNAGTTDVDVGNLVANLARARDVAQSYKGLYRSARGEISHYCDLLQRVVSLGIELGEQGGLNAAAVMANPAIVALRALQN